MASCLHHILILPLFFNLIYAATSFLPKGLLLPIVKDISTLEYTANLQQRTPLVHVTITVDFGAQFLRDDCDDPNYVSSTYRPVPFNSAQCSLANSKSCGTCNSHPRPRCSNNTYGLFLENPFINTATGGKVTSDVTQVQSTDGSNPSPNVIVPHFLFVCAPNFLLKELYFFK